MPVDASIEEGSWRPVVTVVAGVRFQLAVPSGIEVACARSDMPAVAAVSGRLRVARPSDDVQHKVRWSWSKREGRVVAPGIEVALRARAVGAFDADMRVARSGPTVSRALQSTAKAVVYRMGGFVLHAAAAELHGGAILFVGPSGAGKTTARNLVAGGRAFATDRVLVDCAAGRWFACALAGGNASADDLIPSVSSVLPLFAVLGVLRGTESARLEHCDEVGARLVVRESAFSGGGSPDDEIRLLEGIEGLCESVPVGVLWTVRGTLLTQAIGDWLKGKR